MKLPMSSYLKQGYTVALSTLNQDLDKLAIPSTFLLSELLNLLEESELKSRNPTLQSLFSERSDVRQHV